MADDSRARRPSLPAGIDEEMAKNMVNPSQFNVIATSAKGKNSSGLFSLRRPRDGMSGFSSGVKNIFKGVGMGVATLVAAPVAGYREGGAGGMLKGLGVGVLGAGVIIGTGVVTGAAQMGRGIAATPGAIKNRAQGKDWDSETRTWIKYDLQAEAKQAEEKTEEVFLRELAAERKKEKEKERKLLGMGAPDDAEEGAGGEGKSAAGDAKAQDDKHAAAMAQMSQKQASLVLETLWNATVLDIEGTLRRVCYKVTRDQGVPPSQRKRRCKALKRLGEIFCAKGNEASEGLANLAKQLEAQMGVPPPFQEDGTPPAPAAEGGAEEASK